MNSFLRLVMGGLVAVLLTAGPALDAQSVARAAEQAEKDHDKGAAHHDENDLSYANATPELASLSELRADLAIYTLVVFLLLFGVLLKFAWGPIMQGLAKRERTIQELLDEAKSNAASSEAALRQYEAKLAASAEESRNLIAEARRTSEQMRESIVAEARAAAQRERERAVEDITAAKHAALAEIAQRSVQTAVGLAGRILRRELGPQDQDRLAREAMEQFPSNN